jgi:predicted ATP-dependent endonuclease of OLD family
VTELPLVSLRIRGFRTARDITLAPGPVTALIGTAGSGKSNLLAAIWKLLATDPAPLERADTTKGAKRRIRLQATLRSGDIVTLDAAPGREAERRGGSPPHTVFLPASARADLLVAHGGVWPRAVQRAVARDLTPRLALLHIVQSWLEDGVTGRVVLIEEPELFLRPQAQRALYRLLRQLAALGNQVLYSTHAATFLNVGRLEELALVSRDAAGFTSIARPVPLPETETFRALGEFDAERSELLLARAALLVEGMTEKLVFPFFFRALGYDADLEGISIVECGGKPNIPVIARVCNAVGIPYVVVHDRDAAPGDRPIPSEQAVNKLIRRVAGSARTVLLSPDFEAVAKLHGHRHKPRRAATWFALADSPADVPKQLASVVHRCVALAREGGGPGP